MRRKVVKEKRGRRDTKIVLITHWYKVTIILNPAMKSYYNYISLRLGGGAMRKSPPPPPPPPTKKIQIFKINYLLSPNPPLPLCT